MAFVLQVAVILVPIEVLSLTRGKQDETNSLGGDVPVCFTFVLTS